jgi:hypothetical protein
MPDEIEPDFERALAVGNERRRQPARMHVQRHVPPVIDERCQRKPDLANDLSLHVQRAARVPPLGERQRRPAFRLIE